MTGGKRKDVAGLRFSYLFTILIFYTLPESRLDQASVIYFLIYFLVFAIYSEKKVCLEKVFSEKSGGNGAQNLKNKFFSDTLA